MKNRLTKFFTVFLAVVLCIGMAPATGSTAYAASRRGGSSISNWLNSWVGGSNSGSNNNNSSSNSNQAGKNDATGQGSNQLTANSTDETGTADEIQLTKKAVANGTTEDGKPKFNIELGVKGKEVKKGAPVDFTLVVDLSASMTDNGSQSLAITKNAAKSFIETVLADGNKNVRVAIVAYGTMGHAYNFAKKSWNLYGSTITTDGYYTSSRADALAVIDSDNFAPKKLSPTSGRNYTDYESGGTNTEAGFLTAQAVTATRKSNAMSKVVFMTDGVPTYHYSDGTTVTGGKNTTTEADFNEAVSAGKALKAAGNDIYTVGLLTSYDEGSSELEMANKLLSDEHSYSYGSSSSVSYNEIRIKNNSIYYINKDNLWIKDGKDYVQVQVDKKWNKDQYTYTYTQNGETKTVTSKGLTTNPGLTLYTKKEHQGTLGYTENGAAYSDKYYPITDANTAADQIKEIYTNIAKESLVLATGDIVDYIPDGFTVDETSVREAGGTISTDASGKTIVKFPGVPAGKDVATKTFTVVYTGDKYGVAYTNTKATYSGTLYDNNKFSKDFPLPVVGLNPATTDDEYYLDPNTDSNLAILDNDTLNQIAEDGYSISDLQVTLSNVPEGVTTAKVEKVNGKYVVVFNAPAGDYEFNYVITATATKGDSSVGLPAENQDGWNADKTQFTITSKVTNVKVHIVAAANKAFVVDFDKPVTYSANQVFDTNELKANITLPKTSGTYGNMSLNDNRSITYTLTKFMDGIDKFIFNENYGGKKDVSKSVSMIPATSVYYDDSFGSTEEGNGGIVYSKNWQSIDNHDANKELQDAAQGLDANYGYDSSYDNFIGNSNGTVHKVTADANGSTTASITFTGTGIDVYALTNQTGGKVYAKLYSSDGKLKKSLLRDYSYLTGELFHVPVISFNGFAKDTYTLQLTIMKGSTFYLDGVRIYNPLGTDIDQLPAEAKEAYKADGELGSQLSYIRDGILKNSKIITDVQGTVYIDKYKSSTSSTGYVDGHSVILGQEGVLDEYTRYGCKTETYLPAGKSLTLTLDQDYSNIQLGLKSSVNGATYTINNGATRNINSSTDMYYKVTAKDKKITITNTSKAMIEITALKVVK
ncbi:MAG: vWA domain-containing protein [Intestinibacter bartlettii]|uniref:vWA domain-containing protein n=1 Tax=Intestinibacter bartlettii TaxID=261299 RepID=UPI00241CFCC2|nr:vWA domain-containing protein [Intestinibacter bartlettii]